ncbi:YolD-like family protein [Staphylococcus epidermidis]|nr:YolD-like family protein [Staphylococcus epidermidis]MCG2360217.1 YolD-like family protein [Staphylococcus epidermidis]MCG2367215.1 YolD-like family protein [Staphylococcus epidermidis]
MIDKSLPIEFQHETDYRKIPRQYLNPRIPKGRLNVKWAPFATMPQQYQKLNDYIETQNKIARPMLSDEQLETINITTQIKIHNNELANIEYYKNGYLFSIKGFIRKIDTLNSVLVLTNEDGNERMNINLIDIYNVE